MAWQTGEALFSIFEGKRMNAIVRMMMENAAAMKPDELKELLKNRGDKLGGRNVGKDVLLGALRAHQTPVDFEKLAEKLTFEGAKAELKALGKVPPKLKIGELRELVKQAAKEAQHAEEIEQAAEAARVQAMQVQPEQEPQAVQEPQEPRASTPNKKKRKQESVEAALSPVHVKPGDVRKAYYKAPKKREPTRQQKYESNHGTFTAEEYRVRKIGAKKAGKKRRLEMQQNAYDLRPGLGEIIEIGFRFAVGETEEKTLTWFSLAHVMSTAANRQLHPGIKEAAQEAWMPSTTIMELEQRAAQSAAFNAAYRAGAQQALESGSDSDSDV